MEGIEPTSLALTNKEEDFIEMEKRLRGLKGKFVLSLNDAPEVHKLFRRFRVEATDIAHTAQTKPGKRYGDLLITNFNRELAQNPAFLLPKQIGGVLGNPSVFMRLVFKGLRVKLLRFVGIC